MTSSRDTLQNFIDAAAQAVAREIATVRRDAQRERELFQAQGQAAIAELRAEVANLRAVTTIPSSASPPEPTPHDIPPGNWS